VGFLPRSLSLDSLTIPFKGEQMKLRELRESAADVAAIPQKINMMVTFSFVALVIATAALVIVASRSK
jgi:hypothetical protein